MSDEAGIADLFVRDLMINTIECGQIPHLCRLQRITVDDDAVRLVVLTRRSGWTESLGMVCPRRDWRVQKDYSMTISSICMDLDQTLLSPMTYTDKSYSDPDEHGTRWQV